MTIVERRTVDEITIPGRATLSPGTEFTARGIRGRLRFRQAVHTPDGSWVDAHDKDGRTRSIALDRVTRVHRDRRTKPPQQWKPPPRRRR